MASNEELLATIGRMWREGAWTANGNTPSIDDLIHLMHGLRKATFNPSISRLHIQRNSHGKALLSCAPGGTHNDLTFIGANDNPQNGQLCVEFHTYSHMHDLYDSTAHNHRCGAIRFWANGTTRLTTAPTLGRGRTREQRTTLLTDDSARMMALAKGAMVLHLLHSVVGPSTDAFSHQSATFNLHLASQQGDLFMTPELQAAAREARDFSSSDTHEQQAS